MTTQAEMITDTKASIVTAIYKAIFGELFSQDYTECLTKLIGKEINVGDGFFTISKSGTDWIIERKGLFSWMVKFGTSDRVNDGILELHVSHFKFLYNEYDDFGRLLGDMVAVVPKITCAYHPDGRKLEFITN